MISIKKCVVCNIPASQLCAGCRSVVYCSRDHQKFDWKAGHKSKCKSYEIAWNETLGRHMRATREIKKGEVILRELPMIIGPKIASWPVCLGCHQQLGTPNSLNSKYYKCSKCTWPLCGSACEKSLFHKDECDLMASKRFDSKIDYNTGRKESGYCVILPLRCMLLKRKNPADYEKLMNLEDHLQERIDTPLYKVLRVNLITFIKTILGVDEWSDTDIMRVAAILDTNSFEVRQAKKLGKVRALYPTAAMIAHDCVPNCRHIFDDQMQIIFLAKRKIAKGEAISISYTQPLKSTLSRRTHLQQTKCFLCTCTRCKDPEELGTFAGAVICKECKIGKMVSTNSLQNEAPWQCQICKRIQTAAEVLKVNAQIQQEIDSLDKSSPQALESFLYKFRILLHNSNSFVLEVKYALTQLYGNVDGFRLNEINENSIQRKIELCEELLQIADVVDGGMSFLRGNLLLDLQEAFVVQAQRAYSCNEITAKETKKKLESAKDLLLESAEILGANEDLKHILESKIAELEHKITNFDALINNME